MVGLDGVYDYAGRDADFVFEEACIGVVYLFGFKTNFAFGFFFFVH